MDLRQRKKQEEVSSLTDFTVLHIEDDHIDAEWAQRAFSEYKDVNFNVEWVRTASSAKDILSKKEFDLIVLDLSLPDGFGLDLFKEIKEVSGKAEEPHEALIYHPRSRITLLEESREFLK